MNWPAAGRRSAPIRRRSCWRSTGREADPADQPQQADHAGIQRPGPEDDPEAAGGSVQQPGRVPVAIPPGPDLHGRPRPAGGTGPRLLVSRPARDGRLTARRGGRPATAAGRTHRTAIGPDAASSNRLGQGPRPDAQCQRTAARLRSADPRDGSAPLRDGGPVRQEPVHGRHDQDRRADPPPAPRAGRAEARDLFAPRPLADRPGLAAPGPSPDPRLHRPDLRAVRRAARRPRRRRRQGDRDRPGPPRRAQDHVHRPPEGEEPGRADRLPLRLRPSRRAIARRWSRCGWPRSSACRSSRSSTRPGPIRGSRPRSGARRR